MIIINIYNVSRSAKVNENNWAANYKLLYLVIYVHTHTHTDTDTHTHTHTDTHTLAGILRLTVDLQPLRNNK